MIGDLQEVHFYDGNRNRTKTVDPTAAKPAAGPLTLECDPLMAPTTMPPMIPASKPENRGAPDARAIPKQSGSATRNTTTLAVMSRGKLEGMILEFVCSEFSTRFVMLNVALPKLSGNHFVSFPIVLCR